MQLTHKTHINLLLSLLAVSVFALPGCRTGGFPKPDLARLAFWKKDGDALAAKSVPPPPARHFDPAPLNGDLKNPSEVVDLDGGNLRKRFDNNIDQALSDLKSAANEPIRKPYSTEAQPTGNEFAPAGFVANSGNVRSKLAGFDNAESSASGNNLSAAQKEFQAAMNNTTGSSTGGFAPKTGASNEFAKGWKEDIKLPTGLSSTPNNVDRSLASVNHALNNANRRLAEAGSNAAGSFPAQVDGFKNNLASATKPISDFASNNNFAPPSVATNAASSASMNTNSGNSELERVQAQVAEAKQQIARLKMQIEQANRNASLSAPTGQSTTLQPAASGPERVAQLQMPNFKSAYANPGSIGSQPTNVLRSANQPLLPKPNQPLLPQTQPDNFSPNYPSTPHGGYAPQGVSTGASSNVAPQIKAEASQANFESRADESKVVTAGSQPEASDSASRIQNYVSEVDIPNSVLKGTGSYAPGSVNALKK